MIMIFCLYMYMYVDACYHLDVSLELLLSALVVLQLVRDAAVVEILRVLDSRRSRGPLNAKNTM